jgi:hypothetical protein
MCRRRRRPANAASVTSAVGCFLHRFPLWTKTHCHTTGTCGSHIVGYSDSRPDSAFVKIALFDVQPPLALDVWLEDAYGENRFGRRLQAEMAHEWLQASRSRSWQRHRAHSFTTSARARRLRRRTVCSRTTSNQRDRDSFRSTSAARFEAPLHCWRGCPARGVGVCEGASNPRPRPYTPDVSLCLTHHSLMYLLSSLRTTWRARDVWFH